MMGRPSANYSARQRTEGKAFQTILYPDSTTYDYDICMNNVRSNWAEYYYITHDCDHYEMSDIIDSDDDACPFVVGELKKPHTHIVAISSTPCLLGNATKKFGLICSRGEDDQSHYVQKISVISSAVRYLSHIDYPDKFQYDWHTIVHKPCSDLARFFKGADYEQGMSTLIDYVINNHVCYQSELNLFARENHLLSVLTRGNNLLYPMVQANYRELLDNQQRIVAAAALAKSATTTIAD